MEMLPEEEGSRCASKRLVTVRPPIEPAPYDGHRGRRPPREGRRRRPRTRARDDAQRRRHPGPGRAAGRTRRRRTIDYAGSIDGVAVRGRNGHRPTDRDLRGALHPRLHRGHRRDVGRRDQGDQRTLPRRTTARRAGRQGRDLHDHRPRGQGAGAAAARRRIRQARLAERDPRRAQGRTARPDWTASRPKKRAAKSARELLDKLVAANDFPLPQVLVDREIEALLDESKQYVARAWASRGTTTSSRAKKPKTASGARFPRGGRAARQNDAADRRNRQAREDRGDAGRSRSGARCARAPVRAAAGKDHRTCSAATSARWSTASSRPRRSIA